MDKEIQLRKITYQEEVDILCWGFLTQPTFNIKEAYMLRA